LISLAADSFVDFTSNPFGNGVLANVQFQALASGVSPLHFSNVFLNLFEGFTVADGQITVGTSGGTGGDGGGGGIPTPEPSTLALVGIGLGVTGMKARMARKPSVTS
jgi:hypothetical protein